MDLIGVYRDIGPLRGVVISPPGKRTTGRNAKHSLFKPPLPARQLHKCRLPQQLTPSAVTGISPSFDGLTRDCHRVWLAWIAENSHDNAV